MDIFIGENALHKCLQNPKECFLTCFDMSHGNKKNKNTNPWSKYVEVKNVTTITSVHYLTDPIARSIEGCTYYHYVSQGLRTLNIDRPSYNERFLEKNKHLYTV